MKLSVSLALFMAIATAYAAPVMETDGMKLERRGKPARDTYYGFYVPAAEDDEDYGIVERRGKPARDTYYGFYVPAAEDDEDYGTVERREEPADDTY